MNAKIHPIIAALSLLAGIASAAPNVAAQSATQTAGAAAPGAGAQVAPRARTIKAVNAIDDGVPAGPLVSGQNLTLFHGEVQVLDLPDVARIAVGDGAILKATVAEPGQVILIGEGAGNTTLRMWTRKGTQFNYPVTVRAFDTTAIMRDVQDLLAGEPGISVKQVDGHVLIEGDYTGAKTASRIEALMKIYPQIVSIVPLRKAPVTVPVERMVHMDVRVVEIRKTALENLGVNWSAQAAGPSLVGNLSTSHNILPKIPNGGLFGIATNLTSVLDVLEQDGDSWTLAEPKVSCKSGGEAKFTVGGEIPVPVAAGLGTSTVIYKKYGIILEFKPVLDEQGNVSSTIVAEVSEPDPTFSNVNNNGLVAFRQNRTETEVSLKENETLVISGLLRNSGSQAVNGIPGLKDVPVLGNLFKSKNFQNERTELVVMVTPRSTHPQSEMNVAAVRQADEMAARVTPVFEKINSKIVE